MEYSNFKDFEKDLVYQVFTGTYIHLSTTLHYHQRWDMYVFLREPKFSSIGYKVGARFRLSYKYINVPCLVIIFISLIKTMSNGLNSFLV
jgi:hypothetical protein